MENRMEWSEMKSRFPDEWLLIGDFETDEDGHLIGGVVEKHSKHKDEVYGIEPQVRPSAFRYTGESTFSGLRSHAAVHHAV